MTDRVLSGGELSRQFHADAVAPLLARAMPGLGYAAGRLGSGSDVLGFDDAMSRDHDWGCRLTLLVDEADRPYRTVDQAVQQALLAGITNPDVIRLPPVGSVEQWTSSVDILASPARRAALKAAYQAWANPG